VSLDSTDEDPTDDPWKSPTGDDLLVDTNKRCATGNGVEIAAVEGGVDG
jgi:hypothetical protein